MKAIFRTKIKSFRTVPQKKFQDHSNFILNKQTHDRK